MKTLRFPSPLGNDDELTPIRKTELNAQLSTACCPTAPREPQYTVATIEVNLLCVD